MATLSKNKQEGFWYSKYEPHFPMPVARAEQWKNKESFVKALRKVQSWAYCEAYKGSSCCRLCNNNRNGSETYSCNGWEWPEGLLHYIVEHNVKPTLEFRKFIRAEAKKSKKQRDEDELGWDD